MYEVTVDFSHFDEYDTRLVLRSKNLWSTSSAHYINVEFSFTDPFYLCTLTCEQ